MMRLLQEETTGQIHVVQPGQMVDIGGFSLHSVVCGQGTPTVLFEPAMGGFALQYRQIQSKASAFTRTMAYDRAGQGWSEVSPNPRTPTHLARELNTLLEKLDLHPPYIILGHSFGGMLARIYAGLHPQDVAGLILVDATHIDEYEPFPDLDQFVRLQARIIPLMKVASRLGLAKILTRLGLGNHAKALLKADLEMVLSITSQPKHLETQVAEFSQHRCYFGPRSEVPRNLGNLPLMVVTAENSISGKAKVGGKLTGDEMNQLHQKLQKDLLGLSSQSQQVVVPGATHFSILTWPEHAAHVVNAIRYMVKNILPSWFHHA